MLAKWPLDVIQVKTKIPAGEPKPRSRPRKNPIKARRKTGVKPDIIDKKEVPISITKTISKIYKPRSYNDIINNPVHGCCWRETIEKELQSLESHQTWEYKELPFGQKAIKLKRVFKVKYYPDKSVARFKARLVAQRFSQVPGFDFCETFVPIVKRKSLQIHLALYLALNLFFH